MTLAYWQRRCTECMHMPGASRVCPPLTRREADFLMCRRILQRRGE